MNTLKRDTKRRHYKETLKGRHLHDISDGDINMRHEQETIKENTRLRQEQQT